MATRVRPTVTIPNTPAGILDYLVQRTSETVGELVDRAHVVVVGDVQASEASSVPVKPEHEAALQPWLAEEAGPEPHVFIHVTPVRVEQSLVGLENADTINLAYVYPAVIIDGGMDAPPLFDASDRGLLFLRTVAPDVPYAPYLPQPAYELAPGETGVRNFLVDDYDEQDSPFSRDETAQVEETIAAVKWYVGLPRQKDEARRQALLRALDHRNPRVVRHAVRALASRGDTSTAAVFSERLEQAGEDLTVRLMLALWIVGAQGSAGAILDGFFQRYGKHNWLARWDVEPTLVEEGEPVKTLYGPDPVEFKGD